MPFTVDAAQKDELLVTYAALILNDDKVDITAENISKLISAANASVEPYWPTLFAGLLKDKDVDELLLTAAGAPGAGGAAPAAGGDSGAAAAAEEAAPAEESESEEVSCCCLCLPSSSSCCCPCPCGGVREVGTPSTMVEQMYCEYVFVVLFWYCFSHKSLFSLSPFTFHRRWTSTSSTK